jgi:hypothetical protein
LSAAAEPDVIERALVATITGVEIRAFETVDQAADSAVAMLAEGGRLSRLWRYVFVQMLDDYTSVLRHAGVSTAARMWIDAPGAPGTLGSMPHSRRWPNIWPAGMGGRSAWARLPEREAWPWWFVTDLRGLHPRALVESPSSFRRRGVFITSGALDRV